MRVLAQTGDPCNRKSDVYRDQAQRLIPIPPYLQREQAISDSEQCSHYCDADLGTGVPVPR